ncbi:DUF1330 domain-containing protein [Jannaschia seohaensis]|uniref:Uncharacterized conserved protein, DUF1330 family n=1 Tax=Jannaschia seohaensis TaxID=475081 RepID=A0A2Y9AZM6_9RHOB|nr:DUF1330 domain-containing protein [Jannaschia seohaensis]PWJ16893.1 uncharacterized protein (DUF1330 family) [Jannaschia seohaensis]SSA48087.1 Uncharacterized conserved protein, DUF1330 family [Jannaschia seohaensis]
MTAYVIGQIEIHDCDGYQVYLDGFLETFTPFGGTVLATSFQEMTVLEGSWATSRSVLLRFPARAAAQAWFDSAAYQDLARIRRATAVANLVLLDGDPDGRAWTERA